MTRRVERLNSLIKQVISDIIRKEVKNPHLPRLITITHVEVTKDLRYAKVYVSVIGDEKEKEIALQSLQSAAGFIAVKASKQVQIRFFPELRFMLDDGAEKQFRIEEIIQQIEEERKLRE